MAVVRVGTGSDNRVDTSAQIYNFGSILYLVEQRTFEVEQSGAKNQARTIQFDKLTRCRLEGLW